MRLVPPMIIGPPAYRLPPKTRSTNKSPLKVMGPSVPAALVPTLRQTPPSNAAIESAFVLPVALLK